MGDITQLLELARSGDSAAKDEVFARVYTELQILARNKLIKESTLTQLDTHDLVHEVFLRMTHQPELPGANRRVFFAYAAKVMRSVIVDYVRERNSKKRGGDLVEVTLTTVPDAGADAALERVEFEALDAALKALERIDERCHRIVEMRYFAGLSIDEIADILELSSKTVKRDWQKARTFLYDMLKG